MDGMASIISASTRCPQTWCNVLFGGLRFAVGMESLNVILMGSFTTSLCTFSACTFRSLNDL